MFSKLSIGLVILTVFFIPIYFGVLPPAYNVFELVKFSLFKLLGASFIIVFSLWLVSDAKARAEVQTWFRHHYAWLVPPLLFGLYLTVSAWLSGDFSLIFFGSPERQDGVVSFWALFIWFCFLLPYLSLRREADFLLRRAAPAISLSASLVSLYGISQFFGFDFLYWQESALLSRAFSSLGQPNFLAAFLLLSLPLSAYLAYSQRGWWRILTSASVIFQLFALFFTSSRAAIIGLIAGLLILAWRKRGKAMRLFGRKGMAIAIIGLALIVAVFIMVNPGRLSLGSLQNGSAAARVNFLEAGTFALMDRPLLGYGMPGIGEVMMASYDVDWALAEEINTVPDRTHNIVLDLSLSFGMIGWIFFIFWFWRWRKLSGHFQGGDQEDAVFLAVSAYAVSLLFGFITVVNFIYLWFFAACLIASRTPVPAISLSRSKQWSAWGWLLAAGAAACGLIFELSVWRADVLMNRVYVAASKQDYVKADEEYGRLLATPTYPSFSDAYRFAYVQLSWERLDLGQTVYTKRFEDASLLLPETNFNSSLLKAMALGRMGKWEEASRLFIHAQSFSTHLPLGYYRYGRYLLEQGNYDGAVIQLYMAALNAPDPHRVEFSSNHGDEAASFLSDVYLYIGQAYVAQSRLETARDYFSKSLALDVNDPRAIKGMADTYFLQGNFDRAAEYIAWGRTRFPDDSAWITASQSIEDNR